jgi:hypothetical protein
MGTSMHMYVEKRQGDRWVYVPPPAAPPKGGLPNDWYSVNGSCYDEMAVICGIRSDGEIVPAVDLRGKPPGQLSPELEEAFSYVDHDPATWFMLSELEAHNFDQIVTRMVWDYTPEQVSSWGLRPDEDGTPPRDVQRVETGTDHNETFPNRYTEQAVSLRSQIRRLFPLMESIRQAAGVPSHEIRVSCIFW